MDGVNYWDVLGVDEPAPEAGENEREVAAPAPVEGENEQEVAAPAASEEQTNGNETETEATSAVVSGTPQSEAETPDEGTSTPEVQSAEENAKYAAARRRAEAEAAEQVRQAVEAERARQQAELAEFFQAANLIDTSKNTPIRSMEEFRAWRETYDAARRQQIIEKSGLSDDEFQSFVNEMPEVRAARQAAEEAARARARAELEADVAEIAKYDSTVRTVADLTTHESYRQVYDLVGKGYSLNDAWRIANFERLQQQTAARAQQAERNAARGMEHMTKTPALASNIQEVPADIEREYLLLMPNATPAEVRQHYNEYLKMRR